MTGVGGPWYMPVLWPFAHVTNAITKVCKLNYLNLSRYVHTVCGSEFCRLQYRHNLPNSLQHTVLSPHSPKAHSACISKCLWCW